jgi:predicted membrane chloride channel (bestrophin family)
MGKIGKVIKIIVLVLIAVAVFSLVIMRLWNWLMPALFGLHIITYWQALGVLVLSKILFGGFRGRSHFGGRWRHRMMERWEHMTPEEREKFRQGMRGRCGHFPSTAEPKA